MVEQSPVSAWGSSLRRDTQSASTTPPVRRRQNRLRRCNAAGEADAGTRSVVMLLARGGRGSGGRGPCSCGCAGGSECWRAGGRGRWCARGGGRTCGRGRRCRGGRVGRQQVASGN